MLDFINVILVCYLCTGNLNCTMTKTRTNIDKVKCFSFLINTPNRLQYQW